MPFAGAEAALDARLALAGRAGGGTQGGVARQGEERAAVGDALGLLDLERGLNVGAREVLLPHERGHEVRVVLAWQRAKDGHERELVVKVANGVHTGGLSRVAGAGADLCDLLRVELNDARHGLLDAGCDGRESLFWPLDDREQVVVHAEAHSGDLLDVHVLDCGPHPCRVVVVVDNVGCAVSERGVRGCHWLPSPGGCGTRSARVCTLP
jgi:hypothetical protein